MSPLREVSTLPSAEANCSGKVMAISASPGISAYRSMLAGPVMAEIRTSLRLSILYLLLSITGTLGRTLGDDFLDAKEAEVMSIAKQAEINHEATCALVANCSLPGQCSRGGCSRLLEDVEHHECVKVTSNSPCHDKSSNQCDSIQVTFQRSYVRMQYVMFTSSSIAATIEMRNAICAQRELDPTFRDIHAQEKSPYYFNYYFGSMDGAMRYYPGIEPRNCTSYDPRVRPWFTGAISVVKDLVVLVDVGSTMDDLSGVIFQKTSLQGAQILTEQLVVTLTPYDRATIISYGQSSAQQLADPYVVPSEGLNSTDPVLEELLSSINNIEPDGQGALSNITRGLAQALDVFLDGKPDALKILVVFTNGKSAANVEELDPVLGKLRLEKVTIFIFQLGLDADSNLAAIACHNEQITADQLRNPLYSIKSYFSFLANNRRMSNDQQKAFWQPVYQDYGILGSIITVAYPAISPAGELVGVAGIDIQVTAIDPVTLQLIEKALQDRITAPPIVSQASGCGSDNSSVQDCNSQFAFPLCTQTDFRNNYTDLICCPGCGGIQESSRKVNVRNIAIGCGVPAVLLLFLLVGCIYICYRKRYPAEHFKPASPGPTSTQKLSTNGSTA